MSHFQDIYLKLLNRDSHPKKLTIKGNQKEIKAMTRLTSKNYLDDGGEYIKIIFTDGSFLLAIKNDEEFYFADSIIEHIQEIPDEDIGKADTLKYKNKEYKLENKDDYQYVLELIVGTPLEIEGECRFSDYFPIEGTKEFLSLGWLSETGKRADINPIYIDTSEVELSQ